MGGISRREFLRTVAVAGTAAGSALWLPPLARAVEDGGAAGAPPFLHGVASGDPLHDAVMLWTRVTLPRPEAARVPVRWEVARDEAMQSVVASGLAHAEGARDFTVKVDARGLFPGETYWYRFTALGSESPVGRTRTARDGATDRARFAVLTCGDFTRGLFHAYRRVAERDDLDAVIHLGDYIYEGRHQNRVRPHVPARECRTVEDYRARYASYRSDPHLAAMHAAHPVIWVWDDHETVDGTWMHGADPSNHGDDLPEEGPGTFEARKAAALQAALEWMPIRSPDPAVPERIYRRFAFGDLVDLLMIDTRRIGRDRQGAGNVQHDLSEDFFTQTGEFADPTRHILGAAQEAWLLDSLRSSAAKWRLLGNQVVLSHIKVVGAPDAAGGGVYANPDQWDGYAPARARLFDAIEGTGGSGRVEDLVVLTGDVHASMAFEVTRDPNDPAVYDPVTSRGTLAVELVAPSISSASDPQDPDDLGDAVERLILEADDALRVPNPHLKHIRAQLNGYLLVDVDEDRLRAEYWLVPFVGRPTDEQFLDAAFTVPRGEARLEPA